MRSLEIPYNFDKNLIDGLKILDSSGALYHSIYLPPYQADYHSTRRYQNDQSGGVAVADLLQQSREEYESHIEYINTHFPQKLSLLLQHPTQIMSEEKLKYYIKLGFTKFCINQTEQAQMVRQFLPEAEIICSITRKLTSEDFANDESLGVFDAFVLFYPFNRDIEAIKNLPKQYKYILLVNSGCAVFCPATFHWFGDAKIESNLRFYCPKLLLGPEWKETIAIRPQDLPLFEPYISYFKLMGRENITSTVLRDVVLYTTEFSTFPDNEPNVSYYINQNNGLI